MPKQFQFDEGKAVAVLVYFASKPGVTDFDKFKASKLLFLADKYHVVRYARPILGDSYCALDNGPIPSITLDLLNAVIDPTTKAQFVDPDTLQAFSEVIGVDPRFQYPRFYAKGEVNSNVLSVSDVEALDHVIEHHGKKSFGDLKALTHSMLAWSKPWSEKDPSAKSADMNYEDFFLDDSDALAGALEEMRENIEIARALSD